jgi:hypothetical protein
MREKRYGYKISVGKPEGKRPLEHTVADGRIILKLMLCVRVWTEFICLRIGTCGGSCEHGNELSGSVKGGELVE